MNYVRHRALLLWLLLLPLTGCLFRSHRVERRMSTAQLKTATQRELVEIINSEADKLHSLNATVDVDTSVGGAKKGKVTEYKEIRGYLLVRTPEMLRFIGLMPIVRNRAFDMSSNGKTFGLWIPAKNKFYVGSNEVVHPSTNPLENLRPQIIYDALLLRPIEKDEIAVLEGGTEIVTDPKSRKQVDQPDYILNVIRPGPTGWRLERKIMFSRIDLQPRRQMFFDSNGNIATDVHYDKFKDYSGVQFPSVIQISRPQEEYSITLGVVKMTLNQPVTDQQFTLTQPPSAQVVHLDNPTARASDGNPK